MNGDYVIFETFDEAVSPTRWFTDLVHKETTRLLALRADRIESELRRQIGEGAWTLMTNNTTPRLAPHL